MVRTHVVNELRQVNELLQPPSPGDCDLPLDDIAGRSLVITSNIRWQHPSWRTSSCTGPVTLARKKCEWKRGGTRFCFSI